VGPIFNGHVSKHNMQQIGMPPFIGVECVSAESAVGSRGD
jgi:hypothetical protein